MPHQIEPELLQPKPRQIVLRKSESGVGRRHVFGCFGLFLLPFVVVGFWTQFAAINHTLIINYGKRVPGQIISRYFVTGDTDSSEHWEERYRYEYGNRQYVAEDEDSTFGSLQPKQSVPVKIAQWLPYWDPLLDPQGTLLGRNWDTEWGFAVGWNSLTWMFVYFVFIGPLIKRLLLVSGDVAVGTIKYKLVHGSDDRTFKLEYEFVPRSSGLVELPPCMGLEIVSESVWDSINVGDQMTILYHPKKPCRSMIYSLSDYMVIDAVR